MIRLTGLVHILLITVIFQSCLYLSFWACVYYYVILSICLCFTFGETFTIDENILNWFCMFLHLVHSTLTYNGKDKSQSSNPVASSIAQCITQCFGQGTMLFLEKILFKLPETTGPKLKAHVCLLHHLWHVLYITGLCWCFLLPRLLVHVVWKISEWGLWKLVSATIILLLSHHVTKGVVGVYKEWVMTPCEVLSDVSVKSTIQLNPQF